MEFGAIFDWDGVVIDSSLAHEKSWDLLAEEEGKDLPEGHFKAGFGKTNKVIIPNILNWTQDPDEITRIGIRKEELYREIVAEEGVRVIPGVEAFLKHLNDVGIACAVGTSTPRSNIDALFQLLGFSKYFKYVVTAEDVSHGKPDPEVFLKAASGLGFQGKDCVVFEDSFMGLEAAKRGGMKHVGLATTHDEETLLPHAPDRIIPDFNGFEAEDCRKLWFK